MTQAANKYQQVTHHGQTLSLPLLARCIAWEAQARKLCGEKSAAREPASGGGGLRNTKNKSVSNTGVDSCSTYDDILCFLFLLCAPIGSTEYQAYFM